MLSELVLVRIDDRLIHGQVVVGWVKACQPDYLVVANDGVAADPLQRSLLEMAITPAFGVAIGSVLEIAEQFRQNALPAKRALLLFATPRDVLRAMEAGLAIQKLNVGGMRFSPGKRQILKAIAIDDEDVRIFRRILELGVRVTVQMVPTDEAVDIRKYLA